MSDKIKKVLYIKNNSNEKNFKFLEQSFNVCIEQINSIDLVGKNFNFITGLVECYDIIILGGGPQHLTKEPLNEYPEIYNQIEIIKYVNSKFSKTKLLIGICLGCQIIGLAFGHQVIQMDKLCLGYNFLSVGSINHNYISKSNDIYLSKFNYNLLAGSFCYHYDQVLIEQDNTNSNIIIIGKSLTNIPYIIKHSNSNIYGFQFHPELTIECIKWICDNLLSDKSQTQHIELQESFNPNIILHFFQVFFEN